MKTYKEFLEENLKKMGALKKQIDKTAGSKIDLERSRAIHRDAPQYPGRSLERDVFKKWYHDKDERDHKRNVKKLQGLVKSVRKDPQGQQHMKNMVKKGRERWDAKTDRLRSDKLAQRIPTSKYDTVDSGERKGKLKKWKQDYLKDKIKSK